MELEKKIADEAAKRQKEEETAAELSARLVDADAAKAAAVQMADMDLAVKEARQETTSLRVDLMLLRRQTSRELRTSAERCVSLCESVLSQHQPCLQGSVA